MNLAGYLAMFPAYTREMPRFSALAGAVLRQAADLMALVPGLVSGFSFAYAEGTRLDALEDPCGSAGGTDGTTKPTAGSC